MGSSGVEDDSTTSDAARARAGARGDAASRRNPGDVAMDKRRRRGEDDDGSARARAGTRRVDARSRVDAVRSVDAAVIARGIVRAVKSEARGCGARDIWR